MRIYFGRFEVDDQYPNLRVLNIESVVYVLDTVTRTVRTLEPRDSMQEYGSNGFAWGYLGTGPTALAYSLLLDTCGGDETQFDAENIWNVKQNLVATWPWIRDMTDPRKRQLLELRQADAFVTDSRKVLEAAGTLVSTDYLVEVSRG